MNLKFSIVSAMTLLVLVACGPGRSVDKTRAVGSETVLGKQLTKTKWCTPASTDGVTSPKFSTLDFSQNGKFVQSVYTLNEDRSLRLQSKDRGTWALVFDRLYTRGNKTGPAEKETRIALTAGENDIGSASQTTKHSTSTTTGESCIRLSVFGDDDQSFCSCDFVTN